MICKQIRARARKQARTRPGPTAERNVGESIRDKFAVAISLIKLRNCAGESRFCRDARCANSREDLSTSAAAFVVDGVMQGRSAKAQRRKSTLDIARWPVRPSSYVHIRAYIRARADVLSARPSRVTRRRLACDSAINIALNGLDLLSNIMVEYRGVCVPLDSRAITERSSGPPRSAQASSVA